MSENQYPPTKPVCQLDADNLYLHQTVADLDPLAADGSYLLPALCVDTDPPDLSDGQAARWTGAGWAYIPDYRGQTAYRTDTHAAVAITEAGSLSDGLTLTPPPSDLHRWDGTQWQPDPAAEAERKARRQAEMWERIKERRYKATRAGVFVPGIGKWFHNDDSARGQYTFLRTLPKLPDKLQWKTMDNSFVTMTQDLLDELSLKMIADEQADFANAERHRAAMLQAENPLDYDYSDGWTQPAPEFQAV